MVFSLHCAAEVIIVFFVFHFFNYCMFVFLCFCALYFVALLVISLLLLVVMGSQHDGVFISGSPPIL